MGVLYQGLSKHELPEKERYGVACRELIQ